MEDLLNEKKKCDFCSKIFDYKLKQCSKCRTTKYCSPYCQKKDWSNHKQICQSLKEKQKSKKKSKDDTKTVMQHYLENQFKANKVNEKAAKEKKTPFSMFDLCSYEQKKMLLLQQHEQAAAVNRQQFNSGQYITTTTNSTFKKESNANIPYSQLKDILIEDLEVAKTHVGKKLRGTLLATGFKIVGVMNVLQDASGNVSRISFYNYPHEYKLSKNTVIEIREPFNKVSNDNLTVIRVDDPGDVILVSEKVVADCEELKEEANQLFRQNKYREALQKYLAAEKALAKSKKADQLACSIYSNISACYLALKVFRKSRDYSKKTLEIAEKKSPIYIKCLWRLGSSYIGLNKFDKAEEQFEIGLETKISKSLFEDAIQKTGQYKNMYFFGAYDLPGIMKHLNDEDIYDFDFPDYIKAVQKVEFKNKGIGLVATKNIHKEKLVLAEKAFVYLVQAKQLHLEISKKVVSTSSLVPSVVEKIEDDLKLLKDLYQLHDGISERKLENLDNIELKLDISKITGICSTNSFSLKETITNNSGLFIYTSLFNHSCEPNANRMFFGNMILLEAAKNIQIGDEISISYVKEDILALSLKKRREHLQKSFNFFCRCSKCLRESS